ncbi:MAG: PQQ-binding-like beta-propeller repeat protein [Planctomycetota bacterium]
MATSALALALFLAPMQAEPGGAQDGLRRTHPEIALHLAADSARMQRRFEDAEQLYRAALELDPGNATLAYGIARCFPGEDGVADALSWLERAVDLGYRDEAVARHDFRNRFFQGNPRFEALFPEPEGLEPRGDRPAGTGPDRWFLFGGVGRLLSPTGALVASEDGLVIPSSDGVLVARAYTAGGVDVFDARTGGSIAHLAAEHAPVVALDFTPDGARVACIHADGALTLSDVAAWHTRVVDRLLASEVSRARPVLFRACGGERLVARIGEDVLLWSAEGERAGRARLVRDGRRRPLLAGHARSTRVAWARGRTLGFLDGCEGAAPAAALEFEHRITSLAWSPSGDALAVGLQEAELVLLDAATLQERWRGAVPDTMTGSGIDPFGDPLGVVPIRFSPSGTHVAVCTVSGFFVACFDARTGERLWRTDHLGGRMGGALPLAVTDRAVVGDAGAYAWDLESGEPIGGWRAEREGLRVLRTAGPALLARRGDRVVVLDGATGERRSELAPPAGVPRFLVHPSGWCTGDPTGTGVDPRSFDPNRLRAARRGIGLLPCPAR